MSDRGIDKGCQTRSFLSKIGSKRPPVFTYDGSVTFEQLENRLNLAVSFKWDNRYCFKLLEATMYGGRKWPQTSSGSQVLR